MFIVFVGPPGAGKGTQAERLAKHLQTAQLSTGELLRSAHDAKTPMGLEAQKFTEKGELVPDPIVVGIVADRVEESDCDHGCLFDGFPRTVAQAEALDDLLGKRNTPLDLVLELQVGADVLRERLLGRSREDDTPETIANRLQVYDSWTNPVLEYYRGKNILHSVDGVGTVDEVFARILQCLEDTNKR